MLWVTKDTRWAIWTFSPKCMLLFVVRTYALQTIHVDVHESTGHTLFFGIPLVNTWTNEAALGLLGKNHQMYAPWLDVRCFSDL